MAALRREEGLPFESTLTHSFSPRLAVEKDGGHAGKANLKALHWDMEDDDG